MSCFIYYVLNMVYTHSYSFHLYLEIYFYVCASREAAALGAVVVLQRSELEDKYRYLLF